MYIDDDDYTYTTCAYKRTAADLRGLAQALEGAMRCNDMQAQALKCGRLRAMRNQHATTTPSTASVQAALARLKRAQINAHDAGMHKFG